MNKTYRLIWNDARQSWTVTHEAASSRGKPASKAKPLAALLAGALLMHGGLAQAIDPATLPTGGQVVSGQASISQSGSAMTINQGSNQAILNWNSFSIGNGASVEFLQPSSSSVALNRVIGTDPSAIYGSLTATGQVFLINPNGVLFGEGARVDVGGLVASTLNIRDEDFLNGSYRFSRDGATGSVVNQGELYGKYVALLAPEVRNEGVIVAQQGTAALAAGEAVTLNITGNRLIGVQVDQASIDTLVENKHLIQADDGMVVMSAQSANGLIGRVVNTGAVEARGIVNDGGVIRLLASSSIEHSGSINADAGTHGKGGNVILMGDLANPDSSTVVSGSISARGGSESGDGGFIETSGTHLKITDAARIDTVATHGQTGQWLLDPYDFTIGTDITGAALGTALNSNSVTIETTASNATCTNATCGAGSPAGNGDIFVHDSVTWSNSSSTLTLKAYRNIVVDGASGGSITTPFLGTVYLLFGQGTSGTYTIQNGAMIADPSGGLGSEPTVYAPDGSTFGGVQLDSTSFTYTSAATAFVRLDSGLSSTYGGSRTINWTASVNPDGTGGTLGTGTDTTGSTAWESAPFTYLTSTTSAGTANYTYSSGISSSAYYWLAGNAVAWTVNKADLTLSGSRTYDGSTTVAGSTLTANGANGETFTVTGAGDASNLTSKDASATPQVLASLTSLALGTSSNGGLASNYNALSTTGSSYTINKADLTLSGSRPEDGTTNAPGSTLTATGVNSETFTVSGAGDASNLSSSAASATPQLLASVTGLSLGAGSNGGVGTNYNALSTTGSSYTITAATGGTTPPPPAGTTTSDGGKLLDIITTSLLKQKNDGGAFSKTIAETLLTKKGKGIETQEKNDALEFIRLAVNEQCGEQCSVNEETILEWLGGVKASPTATLAGSIVYKEVPIRQFAFGTAYHDLSDDKASGGYDSDKAKAILKRAGIKSEGSSEKPDFSDISDDDVNYFFNAARRTDSSTPQSEIVAYLNKYSNKGGTRSFWLEGDRIVSGPSAPAPITRAKEPHYDISAKTNLKPGTRVTVSLKDDTGKTQSRKASVDGQGNVKIEGKVGDMKLPLTVSMSSEKPKYESDSITVGTAPQSVVEQTKVKLSSSITDEEVKRNPPAKLDKAGLRDMINRFADTQHYWHRANNSVFEKVRHNVMLTLEDAKRADVDNGLPSDATSIAGSDFAPDLSGSSFSESLSPSAQYLTDQDLNYYFKTAERFKDVPLATVVAYLNTTSSNGGKRTFRLEDGRIVSTPEKAPHYHVTAETNLQPGTVVTVSIKDASGTTKSTTAVVGENGDVKVDGAVGEMKQPLQIDISSEQPEYQSKPITVFSMRSKAKEAFEKLNARQRDELIQLLYENRWNAENAGNTENPEAEALKKLISTLSEKNDPAYDGAKTALKEALESPNADEKALFEILIFLNSF